MIRPRTAAVLPALLASMVLVVMAAGLPASEGAPAQDDPLAIVPVATVPDDDILALDGAVAVDVFGVGNRTYAVVAAARDDGIQIVDVTDPAAPVMGGSITDGDGTILDGAYDVDVFGVGDRTYAAVAAVAEDGIQVVDITDPAAPVMAGSITDDTSTALDGASAVVVFGVGDRTYAAVASYREGIQIINLTDPAAPAATAAIFDDDHTILLDNTRGVDTFGVGGSVYAVATSRNDDGLEVINVTDPAGPALVARIRDGGSGTILLDGARGVDTFVAGGRTYAAVAALDDNAIQLVEIADPAAPVAVSGVADGPALLLEGAASVTTLNVGRAVYTLAVSMFENGVQVVDVTDPANPVPVHVRGGDAPASSGTARDLAVFERDGSVYAVVATGFFENSLRILEVVPDGSLDVHGAVPPPVPVSAAYHPLTGSVTVTFDAPLGPAVHVDRLHVREAGRGDAGVALSGMPAVEGAVLAVTLDAGRAGFVGAMASPLLDVGGGAVQDMYGNPVPAAAGLPLDVPDAVPPVLDSATYHNSTGLLSVSFSEPIDHAATDYPGLAVIGPSGNLTLADAASRATPDGGTITATLDQTRRGMVGPGSALKVSGGAVADGSGNRIEPATVPITLTANLPPTVDAGPDRTIPEGDAVTLNGTASDPDGDDLAYRWSHDSALNVTLAGATSLSPSFVAPQVTSNTTVTFTLTATDGHNATAADSLNLTVADLAGTPPLGPRQIWGVTLASTQPGVVEATWEAPAEAPADYRVSWAGVGEDFPTWTDLSGNAFPAGPAQTITGLEEGETYKVVVRARYHDGIPGDWSGELTITVAGSPPNRPPTVDAGPDLTVAEGSTVTFSGTASDPDGDALSYLWAHDSQTSISLDGPATLSPSFTAPQVASNTTVTFTLTATDEHNATAADSVALTVTDVPAAPVNIPPSVDAGPDLSVAEGQPVTLAGTATDQDGDQLTYLWTHDSTLDITLENATALSTTFTAPEVGSNTTIAFTLTASDGAATASDPVAVTITDTPAEPPPGPREIGEITLGSTRPGTVHASWNPTTEEARDYRISWARAGEPFPSWTDSSGNAYPTEPSHTITGLDEGEEYKVKARARYADATSGPWSGEFTIMVASAANNQPVADAGPDRAVASEATVELDGSGSNDPDALSYLWSQTSGTTVTLSNATAPSPTFTAPSGPAALVFRLNVTDTGSLSSTDTVTVSVAAPANRPPTVDAGDGQSVQEGNAATLTGTASDPDNDPLTYRWTHDSALSMALENATTLSTTFAAPAVDADTAITFTLTANDGRGASSADTVSVTIQAGSPPDPPQNLRSGATTNTTVTLTWDDPDDATITGYKVLSRTPATQDHLTPLVDDTGSADATHTVRNLEPDTAYVFRVVAINEHGESGWSNFVGLSTPQ